VSQPISRSLLASFIERAARGRLEAREWLRFAVNHYSDEKMENARVQCVQLIAIKANGDVHRLERPDIERLNLLAQDLRSNNPRG
jgi:hypothetical protein